MRKYFKRFRFEANIDVAVWLTPVAVLICEGKTIEVGLGVGPFTCGVIYDRRGSAR